MNFLDKAKIEFKKNNYLKSIRLFEQAIETNGLSLDDKVYAWETIRKIYHNLNKSFPLGSKLEVAKVYKEANVGSCAEVLLEELYSKTREPYFLREIYDHNIVNGKLKLSREVSEKYINILIKEKRPNDIFNFININRTKLEEESIFKWKIEAFFINGDREEIIEQYNSVDISNSKKDFILEALIRYAGKKTNYWQSNIEILNILLARLSADKPLINISKKQITKLILNVWLEKDIDQELLVKSIKICDRYNLNFIGQSIASYLEDFKLADSFEKRIPENLKKEYIDMASDLFDRDDSSEESLVIQNIEFLKSMGRIQDTNKELDKLKAINPHHDYLKNVKENKKREEYDSNEIVKSLLDEISIYSPTVGVDEDSKAFSHMVNFYEQSYIQENYEDMIIGLNLLNLPSVALDVANRVLCEEFCEERIINLEYLKIETLMLLKEYFKVRDNVDDMLEKYPVKDEELYCLIYLKAEAYFYLKEYQKSYKLFEEIESIRGPYRLVRQRLNELEKYK